MNILDFLSPGRARPLDGFHPVARSPLEQRLLDAGATFEERDGWHVATTVPHEAGHAAACGVADLSHLGKLEIRGAVDQPPGATIWYPITPDRILCLCPPWTVHPMIDALSEQARLVLDQTGQLGVIALVGPEARTVLRRVSALDELPASGLVAHIGAHVIERLGAILVVFGQEYGHYLWEALVDAAEPLGGGPVGIDLLGDAGRIE